MWGFVSTKADGPRTKKIGLEGVKDAYELMAKGSKDVFLIEMG